MNRFFADLHIHIGANEEKKPVKITASRDLTFENIIKEALERKGIDIIGIVDCASPRVIQDIKKLIARGIIAELPEGGFRHKEKITIILASEIECIEKDGGKAHYIAYFPFFKQIQDFSNIMSRYITNIDLSSQQSGISGEELFNIVHSLGGVFVPAHAFTPHKSVYGNCAPRLSKIFSPKTLQSIPALELGLSADTYLADRIEELQQITFLSNSDSHSLSKIGREYNLLLLNRPNFKEIMLAFKNIEERKVMANFGLDPKLGKYHRTHCPRCGYIAELNPPILSCPNCNNKDVIIGVLDRIESIADYNKPKHPPTRPVYHYQIPLEFVPGVGVGILNKLINYFGSEMAILHYASYEDLKKVAGWEIAQNIVLAREGKLLLQAGGGGKYGKVKKESKKAKQLSLLEGL